MNFNTLLATTAICGLIFFAATPASAACNLAGSTYTCSAGTDSSNFTIAVPTTFLTNLGGGTATLSGQLSGSGSILKTGNGRLALSGDNSAYTGGLTTNQGEFVVTTSDNLGSGTGDNATFTFNGGQLRVLGSFTNTRAVSMAGAGIIYVADGETLTQQGIISGNSTLHVGVDTGTAGTLVLTGNNTFSSFLNVGATGNAATLSVSTAANLGTGTAAIALNGGARLQATGTFTNERTLTLNSGGGVIHVTSGETLTQHGVISGGNDLTKTGAGTVNLSNTNTYTGATIVNAGTLIINGSNATSSGTTVANTGTLGGTGTATSVAVQNGGALAPGNSIGTLNVNGTLDFASGAHYTVEYSDSAADKTVASGAITINSGAILDLTGATGTYAPNTTYTILQGSSVSGTFDTINNNLAFLDVSQTNTGTLLDIILTRNDSSIANIVSGSQNQSIGHALDDLGSGAVYDAIIGLTAGETDDAVTQLGAGGAPASLGSFITTSTSAVGSISQSHLQNIQTTNLGASQNNDNILAMTDPGPSVAALLEPASGARSSIWLEATGNFGSNDARGNVPGNDTHGYGFVGGIDAPADNGDLYGVYAGYQRGEVETDAINASADINSYHIGAYASHPMANNWSLSTGITLGYHDIDTIRYIAFPGFSAAPKGSTSAQSVNAFIETSKSMDLGALAVQPFANLSFGYTHTDGYTETNDNGAGLSIESDSKINPSTTLGIRTGKSVNAGNAKLNLSGLLGWQHTYGDVANTSTMRFSAGATSFDSSGLDTMRDAAIVGLGADVNIGTNMNAYVGYTGTLSGTGQDHGFKAGLKWDF